MIFTEERDNIISVNTVAIDCQTSAGFRVTAQAVIQVQHMSLSVGIRTAWSIDSFWGLYTWHEKKEQVFSTQSTPHPESLGHRKLLFEYELQGCPALLGQCSGGCGLIRLNARRKLLLTAFGILNVDEACFLHNPSHIFHVSKAGMSFVSSTLAMPTGTDTINRVFTPGDKCPDQRAFGQERFI